MADNINNSNIDDIVNGVKEALKLGEFSAEKVSFEFVDGDSEDSALEFEFSVGEKEEEIPREKEEISEEKNENLAQDSEDSSSMSEEQRKEENPLQSIWTTYVPRFTEVSENYRMRQSEDPVDIETVFPAEEAVKKDSSVLIPVFEDESDAVDPTAELEEENDIKDATVVSSGNSLLSDSEEISTVFKFESGEAPIEIDEPIAEESSDFDDADEGDFNFSVDEEEAFEQTEAEPLTDAEQEPEPLPANKPYIMPDPIMEDLPRANLPDVKQTMALEVVDESVAKKRSEYNSFSDKDNFLDNFLDSIMSIRVRIVAVTLLALMLLVVENVSFFGFDLIKFFRFQGVGGGMAIIAFPFVVGIFLLVLPEVFYSFFAFTRRKLVPEFFITVSFCVLVFYNAIVMFFAKGNEFFLLNSLFGIIAWFALISSYYKKKADFLAFKVVSANGEKKVVDRKLTRNLPAEHRALDGKVESYKSRTARVFKTTFVADFSARSSVISENTVGNVIILSVSLGIALVGGVIAFFIPGGIVAAAMTFASVYMVSLPVFVIITHKIPFYQASAEAARENSAVIGEKSLYDYSGVDVITFEDTEIFGKDDVNLQRIMVYGRKENLPKALQQMSALFSVVGGPLAYIFADALDRHVSPADNVAVDSDGVIGDIDGVQVMAGSAEFMQRRGVEIPYDPTSDAAISQTTRIMYASEGGEIYAKFYVRYMLSEDFTMILPILTDDGVSPLVYTRDPNVDNGLFRSLTAGSDSIRVLKKQNLPDSEVRLYRRISLGMVSRGDKINVINTLLLSKKYATFQTKIALAELPALIGGAMLGLLLSICVPVSVPSALISLWYIGWSGAVILFGKRLFGAKKDKTKDKD